MVDSIKSIDRLEGLLSEPTDDAVAALSKCPGDIMLLGAGGKMGPSLARMARRASDIAGAKRKVIAVSRFTTEKLPARLEQFGVETIRCDLTDQRQLNDLPNVANVIFMTGLKFGARGNPSKTRLMNVELPRRVCCKFSQSRLLAFSSGNVYGHTPVVLGGAVEGDDLHPVGDYADSVMSREQVLWRCSEERRTPMVLIRLNYACELRYGVLPDIAHAIWNGQAIKLAMGNFNVIWQGDANAATLGAFALTTTPPRVLNLAGPETLSVRRVAEQLAVLLEKQAILEGIESTDSILSNAQYAQQLFGYPRVGPRQMIQWTADWVRTGGASLNKPTHFEVRDGNF